MHYENLPFKYCGSVAVLCELWTPEPEKIPEGGSPLVIFYHGGGWMFGDKNGWGVARHWRDMLMEKGVAFASAGYRHQAYGGHMPTPAADAADAVRFFRRNAAEYGINPDKIMLSGHSAGGHLSLLVSLTGDKFRDNWSDKETECRTLGAVSLAGPASMQFAAYEKPKFNKGVLDCVRALVGEKWEDTETVAEAEPIRYVERGEAEQVHVLCVQPEEDQIVPPGMAEDICRIAAEKGYDFRRLPLEGTGHCWEILKTTEVSPAAKASDGVIFDFVMEIFGLEM
ncbi:MAG: alpha/beta hydrolase [Clostridia bacterium]|nr:alpha/beta hydrolase [Clostridia bacterium]